MTAGTRIAQYIILEPAGSGGMGEVYKARDTKLNRLAAIKILRPEASDHPARRQRFLQEAQAASALNHPAIVTVYDVIEHEGASCLVMEYIAGRTLDSVIPRGGLRLNEALRIAIQVTEGLRKAHASGIIHRDLKPSNIMIGEEGQVKILDFGLAKLNDRSPVGQEEATETLRPVTEEGAILGTIAYMSPEQAEGRKIDSRTDIFSFGAVLYEMISGQRAFRGDSKLSTLSAVLREDPAPLAQVPNELDRIVRRCLRKDPARRFQHADDLKVALEEVREESESGKLDAPPALPAASRRPAWVWKAVAATTVLLGSSYATYSFFKSPAPPAQLDFQMRAITNDGAVARDPALSPDGKFVAYASDRAGDNFDLWIQALAGQSKPIRLTSHPSNDVFPSFSPDGSTLVFYRIGVGLMTVPALGGEEHLLKAGASSTVTRPRYSPDGRWICYATGFILSESKLMVIPAGGGAPRMVAPQVPWVNDGVWSPDGRYLIAPGAEKGRGSETLWVIPFDGGKPTSLGAPLPGGNTAQPVDEWRPGELLYEQGSELWTLPLDERSWKLGTPRRLLVSTAGLDSPREVNGRVVFASAKATDHLWSARVDSNSGRVNGKPERLELGPGSQIMPALSSDGAWLAYMQSSGRDRQMRIQNLRSGQGSTVVNEYARPKFSPDGLRLAYSAIQRRGIFVTSVAGGEPAKLLDLNNGQLYAWHPAGLVFYEGSPIRFRLLDPVTRQTRDLISHPTQSIHGAELSPDGQWVAFHIPGAPRERLYVAPVRGGKAAGEESWVLISDEPGPNRRPWWSADGQLLYYLAERGQAVAVWAQRLGPDKRPSEKPFVVLPNTGGVRIVPNALGAAAYGPGLAKDRIVYSLSERAGEIWIAEPQAKP